jgi:hypothetical protein
VPTKRRLNFNGLHIVISQKIKFFITTAVKSTIPTKFCTVFVSSSRSTYSFHRNCTDFITLTAISDFYYSRTGSYAICSNGERFTSARSRSLNYHNICYEINCFFDTYIRIFYTSLIMRQKMLI